MKAKNQTLPLTVGTVVFAPLALPVTTTPPPMRFSVLRGTLAVQHPPIVHRLIATLRGLKRGQLVSLSDLAALAGTTYDVARNYARFLPPALCYTGDRKKLFGNEKTIQAYTQWRRQGGASIR